MPEVRTILREVIPVDGSPHPVEMRGPVVHVATRGEDYVELWILYDPAVVPHRRVFRVVGTGQPGIEGRHVGTAVTPSGRFAWHLMELPQSTLPSLPGGGR